MTGSHQKDDRVMAVVTAALRLQTEQREPYVRRACQEDPRLYEEVVETLAWEQRMGSFLDQPLLTFQELAHPFSPGELVSGRFEIVREIGEGAMGVVYECSDRKREQKIAIKCAKPGFRRLLSPELQGALKVRHPNVCLVNEIHTAQTRFGEIDFLTMELLQGETLSARIASGVELPRDEANEIATQLCAGLAAAHRSDVIHRDLKSGNVILCRNANGRVRAVITDFGLSCETPDAKELCGTPRYIAPELWLGNKATQASDIYALGVILFEMVARQSISDELAPLQASLHGAQGPYSELVQACLSIEPQKRCEGFDKSLQPGYWTERKWTRRSALLGIAGAISACGYGAWLERDRIDDLFHPLPPKRFVALFGWPPPKDKNTRPLISSAMDAIENELARAEASDRSFFVIASREEDSSGGQVAKICEALGANLALELSGMAIQDRFQLLLRLVDSGTNTVLRRATTVCASGAIGLLARNAVHEAARVLNVQLRDDRTDETATATRSAAAFEAFEEAEDLRKRPNDDGLNESIEKYKTALDADPAYALAYAKLAIAYSRLYELNNNAGDLELIEENARKGIRLNPKLADGHLALSAAFENRGEQEKAFAEMETALALDPNNSRTLLWQGELYARFNRWPEAEQAYGRLRQERPNYWPAYNDLGYVFAEQGKYREAIVAFQAATAAAPGSALAFSNLGGLFLKIGNLEEATKNFQQSLRLKANDLAYANLAEAMRAEGRYLDALPLSREAIKLNPADDQNWLALADCYDALRDRASEAREAYLKAAAETEKLLKTDPNNGPAWVRLALYREKSHSPREAEPLLERAGRIEAMDLDSEMLGARVYELLGKRNQALDVLADCFRKGATPFEVGYVRDFAALRRDPAYGKLTQQRTN